MKCAGEAYTVSPWMCTQFLGKKLITKASL